MNWTPITSGTPELDRPLLVTIQYANSPYKEVTDSMYRINSKTGKARFDMGSAHDFKIIAWMYQPEEYTGDAGILYNYKWNEGICEYDVTETIIP